MSQPPKGSPQIWIQYEYFKRNPIEQAYVQVNYVISRARETIREFNPDNPDLYSSDFLMARASLEAPKLNSKEELPEHFLEGPPMSDSEDSFELPSSEDDDEPFVDLDSIGDPKENCLKSLEKRWAQKWPPRGKKPDFKVEEKRKIQVMRDEVYCMETVKNLYKYFATKELSNGIREQCCESFFKILIIRRMLNKISFPFLDQFQPPIKKLKIITDFGKLKIEMQSHPNLEGYTSIQYWNSSYRTLIWYGDTVMTHFNRSYLPIAASDVYTLLKHPKMRFEDLIFDIEPYGNEWKMYPDMTFFGHLRRELSGHVKKIRVSRLFLRTCRGPTLEDNQLDDLLLFLKPGYLKSLELPLWDDSRLVNKRDQKRRVHPRFWRHQFNCEEIDAWKKATHLIIEDEDVAACWKSFAHFHRIKMARIDFEDIEEIKKEFANNPPVHECVISVKEPLDLENINRLIRQIPKGEITNGAYLFPTNDNKKIAIRLKKKEMVITTELIS